MENNKQNWKDAIIDFFVNFLKKFGYMIVFTAIGYLLGLMQGASMNSSLRDLAIGWSTINYNNRYYCDFNNKNIKYDE